jgi:uncharacterized protein (TIGR02231 family)
MQPIPHKILLTIRNLLPARYGIYNFHCLSQNVHRMTYAKLVPVVLAISCSLTCSAAPIQQKLAIGSVTVFLSGAELTSTASLTFSPGENEIMFTNVAGDVNSQSITVSATGGVVVEAATFQNNYLATENISRRAQELKDSIELLTEDEAAISNKMAVLDEQIAVLKENRKVSGNQAGLSVAELNKMLDLLSTKMENYLTQKNKQQLSLKKTGERIAKLRRQLDEEQKRGAPSGGQLLVKFFAKEATTSTVTIDYVVPHAGWSPTYDIWADNANSPVKLYYKANIYQNCGVNWNNVHLSLSTGNPNEGAQAPVISPWYLAFYLPQTFNMANNIPQGAPNVMAYAKPLIAQDKTVSNLMADGEQSSINNYVSVDNSGINTTFDIDLPYTIPCDGQQHLVAIKRHELPATYRYYAVPKLDKDVFLQAQITNWENLNLLPGQTNIYYEGAYVGRGNIDVRNIKDTMTLSLGRDKKIVVKRERDVKLRSVKTIGTNVRETFAYTILARNGRKENINLIIQDQLPVSNDKDIVIEDKETGNAEYDETTGLMKWTLSLSANETKQVGFGFTVKYPKGKVVTGLR